MPDPGEEDSWHDPAVGRIKLCSRPAGTRSGNDHRTAHLAGQADARKWTGQMTASQNIKIHRGINESVCQRSSE